MMHASTDPANRVAIVMARWMVITMIVTIATITIGLLYPGILDVPARFLAAPVSITVTTTVSRWVRRTLRTKATGNQPSMQPDLASPRDEMRSAMERRLRRIQLPRP